MLTGVNRYRTRLAWMVLAACLISLSLAVHDRHLDAITGWTVASLAELNVLILLKTSRCAA